MYLLVVCPFNMECLVKNVCSYRDHHFYQIVPPMVHIKYTMSASSKTNNIIAFYYLCSRYNMSNVICLLLQSNTMHVSLTIMCRRCKPSPPFWIRFSNLTTSGHARCVKETNCSFQSKSLLWSFIFSKTLSFSNSFRLFSSNTIVYVRENLNNKTTTFTWRLKQLQVS